MSGSGLASVSVDTDKRLRRGRLKSGALRQAHDSLPPSGEPPPCPNATHSDAPKWLTLGSSLRAQAEHAPRPCVQHREQATWPELVMATIKGYDRWNAGLSTPKDGSRVRTSVDIGFASEPNLSPRDEELLRASSGGESKPGSLAATENFAELFAAGKTGALEPHAEVRRLQLASSLICRQARQAVLK